MSRCFAWSHALAGRCELEEGHEGLHNSAGDGFGEALDRMKGVFKPAVPVSGIWARRIGGHVELLAEVDGEWKLLCKERLDSNFSHIVEAAGIARAPKDTIT